MRYLALWRPQQNGVPPTQNHYVRNGTVDRGNDEGGGFAGYGRVGSQSAGHLGQEFRGKSHVTDGPYAEAKELVAGFAIFQVTSREEAVKWGTRFIEIAGDGCLGDAGDSPSRR